MSTSNRPETSIPPDSAGPDAFLPVERTSPLIGLPSYVPNLLDLIYPIGRLHLPNAVDVPPAFLRAEATDSALLLGAGASFTVTRQVLPRGQKDTEYIVMDGWTISRDIPAPERPRYVAYKAVRVTFEEDGAPVTAHDRRALQSVLTELHSLLHPAVSTHENVVKLLGLAWSSSFANAGQLLPVLVVEYGDLGTLADVQRQRRLADDIKAQVFRGICTGAEVLHQSNIVHGDMKPENIIMCSGANGRLVPKLADFGFAIINSSATPEVQIGGSKAWRAPETHAPISTPFLKLTDVYSLGLVAWAIAIDGITPFDLLVRGHRDEIEYDAEVLRLKSSDEVLGASRLLNWIPVYVEHYALPAALKHLPAGGLPPNVSAQLAQSFQDSHCGKEPVASRLANVYLHRPFWKHLESIFVHSLAKDPATRSLSSILALLQNKTPHEMQGQDGPTGADLASNTQMLADIHLSEPAGDTSAKVQPESSASIPTSKGTANSSHSSDGQRLQINAERQRRVYWQGLGFQHHVYSWQVIRQLEPSVQCCVARAVIANKLPVSQLLAASFYFNGYGVASNEDKGLECLQTAAEGSVYVGQAFIYRCFRAMQKQIPESIPVIDYLRRQASLGSRVALEDLREVNASEANDVHNWLRFAYGGVGAQWYLSSQWLHGLQQRTLLDGTSTPAILGPHSAIRELTVNLRGDKLLHAAAAVGSQAWIQYQIGLVEVDVNQLNDAGETALLCACRAGHPGIVKLLLDAGADASLQAPNGESPLHWLLSFEPKVDPSLVAGDLVKRGGAKVDAATTTVVAHSIYPPAVDIEKLLPGTPLHWAVRANATRIVSVLLSLGADPHWKHSNAELSPLDWAAYLHHDKCLRLLLEHLEQQTTPTHTADGQPSYPKMVFYGPLVCYAIKASDKWSMILRNGSAYLERLEATLQLLHEKAALVRFRVGPHNETLLHDAAVEAHDLSCAALLRQGWYPDAINKPAGPTALTPLLESVRWNRRPLYDLLCQYGADSCALAPSPFEGTNPSWNALHFFADQAHGSAEGDLAFVDTLLAAGVPIDGDPALEVETPCQVAIRRGAFALADHLVAKGASLNALSRHAALFVAQQPLTILGHIIALNAYASSVPGLRYILAPQRMSATSFVVDPFRGWSVFHWCCAVPLGLTYVRSEEQVPRDNFNWRTNRFILEELLESFPERQHLDHRAKDGRTAIHVAVEYAHVTAVKLLVKSGAEQELNCDNGETPLDVAKRLHHGDELERLMSALAITGDVR